MPKAEEFKTCAVCGSVEDTWSKTCPCGTRYPDPCREAAMRLGQELMRHSISEDCREALAVLGEHFGFTKEEVYDLYVRERLLQQKESNT